MQLDDFYEARNAKKYLTSDNPHMMTLVRKIGRWLDVGPNDDVLDVGCSDGYILERLLKDRGMRSGAGIDISPATVALARHMLKDAGNMTFKTGSAEELPFPGESFTKVIVNELIEHVPNDARVFAEVSRVLRPGGLLFMSAPNSFDDMMPLFHGYCRRMDAIEGHLRRYTAREIEAMGSRTGLRLERVEYGGFIWGFVWYNTVVYNDGLKKLALKAITRSAPPAQEESDELVRPQFNGLAALPFALLRAMDVLDAPFKQSPLNMGFHALFRKI
jgi:ubiquinone/menaquinone biosynthesis C-methylase UbiE